MIAGFVRRDGPQLFAGADPFKIVGANTYYLGFVEEPVVRAVLDLAVSLHLNVLRIWAFCERVEPGSFCFQSFESGLQTFHEQNLQRLDRAIALASEAGLRVILTLANNWKDFGGIPAYLSAFGLSGHDQFYRDGRCRAAYWLYAEHLLTRTNSVSGVPYAEDPAILAWELANEPRCPDVKDGRELLMSWIYEMATLVKRKAPLQLVAVGDEGFFTRKGARGNTMFNGSHGVDFEAILGVPAVDFGTYHLYGNWAAGVDAGEFGAMWIRTHVEAGVRANKPVLLEEYGMAAASDRAQVYGRWLREIEAHDSLGDLVWMLGPRQGPGQPYTSDSYVLHEGAELELLRAHAQRFRGA